MSTATFGRFFHDNNHLAAEQVFSTSVSASSEERTRIHVGTCCRPETSHGNHSKYGSDLNSVGWSDATHNIAQDLL